MSGNASAELDLSTLSTSGPAGVSGGIVMVAGALTALLGFQSLDMLRGGPSVVVGTSLLMLGTAGVVCGWNVRKVRGWAALAATGAGAVATLGTLTWAAVLIYYGFFSVLACLLVPVNIAATALAYLRIAPGRAADDTRRQLEERGLDVGM